MVNIPPVASDKADPTVLEIYQGIEKKMGKIPNIFLSMGHSSHVLKAYFSLSELAGKTSLNAELREKIALAIAEANHCAYCLAAHSKIGKDIGISEQEIVQARRAQSEDPKTAAILHFVRRVIDHKGHVSKEEIEELKTFKISDKEITEIILLITLNLFTNYFNHIADPQIDFPSVPKIT